MLKSLFSFVLLSFVLSSSAHALPVDLHDTMKAMSKIMRTLSGQVDDGAQNEASAKLADELVALIVHSKSFTPEFVEKLPSPQKAIAKARYLKSLDETAAVARELAQALRRGDNAKAEELFEKLQDEKEQGHDEFKP